MKSKVAFFSLSLFVFLVLGSYVFDAQDGRSSKAPINPKFLQYLERIQNGQIHKMTKDGYPLGLVPSPVDLSHTRGWVDVNDGISYPPYYFLGDYNLLTPVKDQGSCAASWAFATYGSLESNLMRTDKEWDFSEQDMIAEHGFDYAECSGGSIWMALAYLTRWSGPVLESDVPYTHSLGSGIDAATLQKKVCFAPFFPYGKASQMKNLIRRALGMIGAVYCGMTWNDTAYNASTSSFYYNGADDENLAVCIVGWDDNYAASNFNTSPPGNGAFIARNSRGEGWGDNGNFYVSYYDTMLTPYTLISPWDVDDIHSVYQYDPLGWTWNWGGWGKTEGWGANIFTAAGDEMLKWIGFYAVDVNWNVEIDIYTNVTGSTDPTNGTLTATKSMGWRFPGYISIPLDSPVPLTAGEQFSVVVCFDTDTEEYPIPIEYPWPSYSSLATADPGESFVSEDGVNWYDLGQAEDANVCIKAYTDPGEPEINVRIGGMNFLDGSYNDFGTKPLDAIVGKEIKFTIDNYGNAPLNLTGSPDMVTLSGPDAKYFMVTQQPTSPVAAGSTTTFKIKTVKDTVPPVPVGFEKTVTFDVNIPNNDSDEDPYNFTITINLKKTS